MLSSAALFFNDEHRAHNLEKLLFEEIGQRARHGFPRRTSHRRDFFVSQGELDSYLTLFFGVVRGSFQQEPG
jgi:hypothetical protein